MGHDLPGQLDGHVRLLADAPSKLIGLRSGDKARFGGLFFRAVVVLTLRINACSLQRGTRPHTSRLAYAQVVQVMYPGFDDGVFRDWLSVWPCLFQSTTC